MFKDSFKVCIQNVKFYFYKNKDVMNISNVEEIHFNQQKKQRALVWRLFEKLSV